ncbi:hypothetical protein F4778DRAFT_764362 [Xylariomycetidae sp. FL2044]|nr:hypothetical protein F4778DRAFT_764362 [Xylariomycetidae sp. FL2044]
MPPLIVHNVPEDELYTGEDGIQRPYAMFWPEGDRQRNTLRPRPREVNETGSFGRSSRRSRSRTGSLPPKREDANTQAADKVFSQYLSSRQQTPAATAPTQRKSSYVSQSVSKSQDDSTSAAQTSAYVKQPVEVILRGYATPAQQYAAINQFEQLAGRICEDYSREPPPEARRYKSDLRDPALIGRRALSKEERTKVNKVASGEHWVKVTFESQEAAETAIYASPQKIMGHLVYAEMYRGVPPQDDTAVFDVVGDAGMLDPSKAHPFGRRRSSQGKNSFSKASGGASGGLAGVRLQDGSPSGSHTSTQTMDTATASTSSGTMSTATVTGAGLEKSADVVEGNGLTSRKIPGARKIKLLPADQALVPQPSFSQRLLAWIPLIGWFSGSIIGNEVPRNEAGEFDMKKASLYWQLMYYLDCWVGLFGYDLASGDKDE